MQKAGLVWENVGWQAVIGLRKSFRYGIFTAHGEYFTYTQHHERTTYPLCSILVPESPSAVFKNRMAIFMTLAGGQDIVLTHRMDLCRHLIPVGNAAACRVTRVVRCYLLSNPSLVWLLMRPESLATSICWVERFKLAPILSRPSIHQGLSAHPVGNLVAPLFELPPQVSLLCLA